MYFFAREKPLSLYVFSNDQKTLDRFVAETSSGAICANDTLMYMTGNVADLTDIIWNNKWSNI